LHPQNLKCAEVAQFIKAVKKMYVRITYQYSYSHQLIQILKNLSTITFTRIHERNFVVKCGGRGWCETNILRNLKRKMSGTWLIISPLSEKVGGRVPRVPHLIASMLVYRIEQNVFNRSVRF